MYWRRNTKFGQAACDATYAAEDLGYNKQDVINAFKQVGLSSKHDVINAFKKVRLSNKQDVANAFKQVGLSNKQDVTNVFK